MIRKIVSITPDDRPWHNVELSKDVGLIPYLLGKQYNCPAIMVCGSGEEYHYLDKLHGLEMEFIRDNTIESKIDYIQKNGNQIDILMLHGVSHHNIVMVDAIKKVNKESLVTCALDMNVEYADRIPFCDEPFCTFFSNLDLIWQSDGKMTEFLNEKWYWNVVCERNGYYDINRQTSDIRYYPFEDRDNTLLCVGRVNSTAKATDKLLNAFAKCADRLEGWNLKIIGSIEHPFEEFIEAFFECYPELLERIEFVGNIDDKEILHSEYEKAKVFVSTTRFEGGTPNSIAEAVCSGNVMAITQIEAYRDIIGNDENGLSAPIDDTDAFSDILVDLCTNRNLAEMSICSYTRGKEIYNMERIVLDIYGKLNSQRH